MLSWTLVTADSLQENEALIRSLFFFWLHQVAPKIKAMMMESGTTMVGYQPQGNKVNFFRMVVSNPAATQSDIDFLIDEIERMGHDL